MITFAVLALLAADPTVRPAAEPAPVEPRAIDKPYDKQRVCIVAPVTGSRVDRRECHTRGEWSAMGINPQAG